MRWRMRLKDPKSLIGYSNRLALRSKAHGSLGITLCASADFKAEPGLGYLHVLGRGRLRVQGDRHKDIEITVPSALHFRETVGLTPLDYLTDWRVSVACTMLKKGVPFKMIAPDVGYSGTGALSKVFAKKTRVSPTAWLNRFADDAFTGL